jgi:hypothetical protein
MIGTYNIFLTKLSLITMYEALTLLSIYLFDSLDRLCGLVVRVPDDRSTGSIFDSRPYKIF